MDALIQYDSSNSSELYESDDVNEQPGVDQNVCKNSDDKKLAHAQPVAEPHAQPQESPSDQKAASQKRKELFLTARDATDQNDCRKSCYFQTMDDVTLPDSTNVMVNCQEIDYFGLETVDEDGTDATGTGFDPTCTDSFYKCEKVADKSDSLSVYVPADASDGQSFVSVPNTLFWKGETSVEPIEENLGISTTTTCDSTHSAGQQINSCKRSSAVIHDQNNQHEQVYGYKRKQRKAEFDQSQSASESTHTNQLQWCYRVHNKVGPHLDEKPVNRVPRSKLRDISAHGGIVNKVEWCRPEFSHLLLSASMDRSVKIWDVLSTTPTCVQTLKFHEKAVKDATWSVQGREVLSGGYDRTARICDVEKGVTTSCCHHNDFVTSVKWHPVNHHLFVTGSRNVIKCWDKRNTSRPAKIFMYKEVFGQVQDIVFLRDGSEFLCCTDTVARDSADRSIMAWHFNSGVVLSNQIFQERYTCTRLRMHPSEAQFVSQTQGGYIALFSTIKPYKMNKCKRFDAHQVLGYSVGCDFSPDGRLLASGSADGSLVCYDFHLARKITSLTQPGSVCLDVAWHPVLFSTVATSSDDGTISVWQ